MPGTILRVEGSLTTVHRDEKKGSSFSLELMQKLVGGYVQRVNVKHDGRAREAYVDEEGLLKGLSPNFIAYHLYKVEVVGPLCVWIPDPVVRKRKSKQAKEAENGNIA